MTSQAQAQASRTWISGVGDDANPCSRTAPCKTFAGILFDSGGQVLTFGSNRVSSNVGLSGFSGTLSPS
jgi:hypothetical protein